MDLPFKILEFNSENLAKAFSNSFIDAEEIKEKHFHYKYFLEYFSQNGNDYPSPQTIIIEFNYLSKAFLYDYSSYYSLCFGDKYSSLCKRLHFFKSKFSESDFIFDLTHPTKESKFLKNDYYLGYIVIKDLPNVIIGSTVIKPYPTVEDKIRNYPTIRKYNVNIFGKEFELESTAFQEQDSVVSACATSALWMAFHKTSEIFQTPLPSPSEITKSAGNLYITAGRLFPNLGLDHTQIGNVIDSIGLEFELRNSDELLTDINYYKSFIYAYLKAGIPVLLGIEIESIGRHLITITGYRENQTAFENKSSISLYAEKIERFYAHDDQVGPYSRLGFDQNANKVITSWWKNEDGTIKYKAQVISVFVPLYHKIRINFENILEQIKVFDYYLYMRLSKSFEVVWDVFLAFSNKYKENYSEIAGSNADLIHKVRFHSLPKHIWIARAFVSNSPIIEFVFDSTDVSEGFYCHLVNILNSNILEIIHEDLNDQKFRDFIANKMHKKYLKRFDDAIK